MKWTDIVLGPETMAFGLEKGDVLNVSKREKSALMVVNLYSKST